MSIAAERCIYTNTTFMWEVIQPDGSITSGNNWSLQSSSQHHHSDDTAGVKVQA
jgi:hypothetical protein